MREEATTITFQLRGSGMNQDMVIILFAMVLFGVGLTVFISRIIVAESTEILNAINNLSTENLAALTAKLKATNDALEAAEENSTQASAKD